MLCCVSERHVSRVATNVIEVIRDGLCQPRELYESLIETFSKEGDLILDIGSTNGKLIISLSFSMKRWFTCICDFWPRFPMLHIPFLSFLGKRDGANEMHFNIFLLIGDQYC